MTYRFFILLLIFGLAPLTALRAADSEGEQLYWQGDYAAAHAKLEDEAKAGRAESQYRYAMLYVEERGVAYDATTALQWLGAAAGQGHTQAKFVIGLIALSGRGVEQNLPKAAGWFASAAEDGLRDAKYELGLLYL
ncbi:MAG: tetratricopeptide repeat protein, partial [Pseudomonadota bacterium]